MERQLKVSRLMVVRVTDKILSYLNVSRPYSDWLARAQSIVPKFYKDSSDLVTFNVPGPKVISNPADEYREKRARQKRLLAIVKALEE